MTGLEGKVAIITAGTSRIGKSIVKLFVQQGASVILADTNEKKAEEFVDDLGEGNVIIVKSNPSLTSDQKKIVDVAVENFGALHIAINNTCISHLSMDLTSLSTESWRQIMDIHLNSIFYGMHFQLPEIQKYGGNIVNLALFSDNPKLNDSIALETARSAIAALTINTAKRSSNEKIRINAVGPIVSDQFSYNSSYIKDFESHPKHNPTKKNIDILADYISWLVSENSTGSGTYHAIDELYYRK